MAIGRKHALWMLGGVAASLILVAGVAYGWSEVRLARIWDVTPAPLTVPNDSASIRRGAHTALIRGCRECHGDGLGGRVFVDEPLLGRLWASNLTSGSGGVAARYDTEDWVRAIRHGVGPDGRGLLFMPSQDFSHLGDRDLGDLIAWIRSVPPVEVEPPFSNRVGALGRVLFVTGQLPLLPAEKIRHETGSVASPTPGPTVEYGRYLATTCRGCHGDDYRGGPMPGSPPSAPQAPDLTPAPGGLGPWSESEFFRTMRTGMRPTGAVMDPVDMPWPMFAPMSDDELRAVWRFLRSLPAGGVAPDDLATRF